LQIDTVIVVVLKFTPTHHDHDCISAVQASFTGCPENGGRSFFKLPNMAWESIIATDIYLTTMLHLRYRLEL
jgi:hypothetical protein